MKLYTYWRSSASYRVRIALALKGLNVDHVPVHLLSEGGEQFGADYRTLNPQARVPTLLLDDDTALIQSNAIIEYLEEVWPDPPLLPRDPVARARARSVAALIGSDIHPLHNLAPLTWLREVLAQPEAEVTAWVRHWIETGLAAVEALIDGHGFALGAEPGLVDLFLVPQTYAAKRFGAGLDGLPKIRRVEALATAHPAFRAAHPDRQSDAPPNAPSNDR